MYIPIWFIVLAAVVFFVYKEKSKKKEFEPIRISIEPEWVDLFKDYKLANDNWWDGKVPEGKEYHVLKKGLTFTKLNHDLIYDDDYHWFQTSVNFRRDIDIEGQTQDQRLWMRFCVHPGIEGYELSIVTPESFRKSIMPGDGADLIKVATIPYSEFLFPLYDRQSKKKQAEINQDIHKFEWTRETYPEFRFVDTTVYLKYKYFSVSYEYI